VFGLNVDSLPNSYWDLRDSSCFAAHWLLLAVDDQKIDSLDNHLCFVDNSADTDVADVDDDVDVEVDADNFDVRIEEDMCSE
jgi:hypothetical protein